MPLRFLTIICVAIWIRSLFECIIRSQLSLIESLFIFVWHYNYVNLLTINYKSWFPWFFSPPLPHNSGYKKSNHALSPYQQEILARWVIMHLWNVNHQNNIIMDSFHVSYCYSLYESLHKSLTVLIKSSLNISLVSFGDKASTSRVDSWVEYLIFGRSWVRKKHITVC